MGAVGPSCDIVACVKLFEEEIRFSICPKKNMNKLQREMNNLRRMKADVTKMVHDQERQQPGMECKVEVGSWLQAVNDIEQEVGRLLDSLAQTSNCSCFWSPRSNYYLGKEVVETLEQVEELKNARQNFGNDLVSEKPPDSVANFPYQSTSMIGGEKTLSQIREYLKDDEVKAIRVFGMGGIGKTTVLKQIKHEMSKNSIRDFHFVIWVTVSKDVNVFRIQSEIATCIQLSLPSEEAHENQRAQLLFNALKNKKLLVLMDDVWQELDLGRIGIPFAFDQNMVKIIFTTRSEKVCIDMKAQKTVRLNFLDQAQSLELFRQNISSRVDLNDQIIRPHVDEILARCGGLPLVIITVGRTVASYTKPGEWEDAVHNLRSSPTEIEGMHDVMRLLKFSFDKLGDEKIQSCLLYCSLNPEDAVIFVDYLIKEWIGAGLLDMPDVNSYKRSYDRGLVFINKLKSACLLESGISDRAVKMHDAVRDMACWIRGSERGDVFLVYARSNVGEISDYDRWDVAKGIFLTEHQITLLPRDGMPVCPNLMTLLVQASDSNSLEKFPAADFFQFTPSLRVLDLSHTGLVEIPKSIGSLVELRHLNLCGTRIRTLPVELENLKKLKCLDLGDTLELEMIFQRTFSQLSMLQSLNLFKTSYWRKSDVTTPPPLGTDPLLKFEDLGILRHLEDFGTEVISNSHLQTLLGNHVLLKSTTKLSFTDEQPMNLLTFAFGNFSRLKELIIARCELLFDVLLQLPHLEILRLRELKISSIVVATRRVSHPLHRLRELDITACPHLKELSWTAHIPLLERLHIDSCNGVEELVNAAEEDRLRVRPFSDHIPSLERLHITTGFKGVEDLFLRNAAEEDQHECYFPKLLLLNLSSLENLRRISGRTLPLLFPALRFLRIASCPRLKQLSLGPDSAKNLECIACHEQELELVRDRLEWESDVVRSKFLPYLRVSW